MTSEPQLDACGLCAYPLDAEGRCANCEETERLRRLEQRRVREHGIKSLGGLRAWDTFTFDTFRESMFNAPALDAARAFDKSKDNLYLCGPVGSGKTHLATAAARKYFQKAPVYVVRVADLALEVRAARGRSEVEKELLDRYVDAGVLVLDDLGVEKGTEFVFSLVYRLVDGRYMNRPGGLIVTSNLSLDDLTTKLGDDRVPSRLAQMARVFTFAGEPDHRLEARA